MPENVLTLPMMQNADMQVLPPQVITLAAGVWTEICQPNPQRFALTILPSQQSDIPLIQPLPYGTPAFTGAAPSPIPITVHASMYPLLIAGSWFGQNLFGGDVTVIETIRIRG